MLRKLGVLLITLTCLLGLSLSVSAFTMSDPERIAPLDFGDSVDYGGSSSGGSFDSGGSYDSWDSGGSWGGSGYYSGGGSSGSSSGGSFGIGLVIVIIVIVIVIASSKKKQGGSSPSQPVRPSMTPQNHTERIAAAIKKGDPAFSEQRFIGFAKDIFVKLQLAWMARDLSEIRPLVREELYEQHQRQVEEYLRLGRVNRIERINVKQAYLHLYTKDPSYEYLSVFLQARMNDYVIDEKTQKVLKGDPNRELHLDYLLTFTRSIGVKTANAGEGTHSALCPHCGAPLQMTSSGRCEFCGSVVNTGVFDWTLSEITRVRPDTNIDNRGVIE